MAKRQSRKGTAKPAGGAKRPVGRPSKYDPAYCQQIVEFFNIKPYEDKLRITDKGELKVESPNDTLFLVDFAQKIGVYTSTLYDWAEKYPEFACALNEVHQLQKRHMMINVQRGLFNAPSTIFAMKNMFGWRDEHDLNMSERKKKPEPAPGTPEFVKAMIQRARAS